MKHNWVGAATVLGDGDRSAEVAVCEVPVQAVANAVATMRSATHRRINSANASRLQVVTSLRGHVNRPDEDVWLQFFTADRSGKLKAGDGTLDPKYQASRRIQLPARTTGDTAGVTVTGT